MVGEPEQKRQRDTFPTKNGRVHPSTNNVQMAGAAVALEGHWSDSASDEAHCFKKALSPPALPPWAFGLGLGYERIPTVSLSLVRRR